MASIKNFKKIKYTLTNPQGTGDKVVKFTFNYQGERFSYNAIVPNNPKFKKNKEYIKEAKRTFTSLANSGDLAKYADARLQAKKAKNFSDFDYEVINSSVAGYAEVRATLKYQDKPVTRYLFVKEVPGKKDDYYIDQAKAQIKKEIVNDTLPKESKNYLKPKKVSTGGKVAIVLLAAATIGCGAFLTYKYLTPSFTVSFDSKGGSSIETQSIQKGQLVKEPERPLKYGYDFEGWCSDEDCEIPFDFEKTAINKNTILYADWAPIKCVITIDEGNGTNPYEVIGEYGEPLEEQSIPSYEGHTFAGWYKTPDGGEEETQPYNFNTPIDGDFTLTAYWDKETYIIDFDLDGGTGPEGEYAPQAVDYYDTVTEPADPTKLGYKFDYWYDASDVYFKTPYEFDKPVEGNLTLKAHWSEDYVKVTFDSGYTGGPVYVYEDVVLRGHIIPATIIPTVTREGYTFNNWRKNDVPFTFDTPVTEETTLRASWWLADYTVTYISNGGTHVDPLTRRTYGDTIPTAPPCTYEGHILDGWYPDPEFKSEKFIFGDREHGTPIKSDITLYAKWTVEHHTAKFLPSGGTWSGGSTSEKNVDTNYGTLPYLRETISRPGYTFIGWEHSEGEIGIIPMGHEDITYTAQWDINKYTVTYIPNGGTPVPPPLNVEHGATIDQPECSFEGHTLSGWFKSPTFVEGSKFTFGTSGDQVTSDLTLYAKWDLENHNAIFKPNGGTWSGASEEDDKTVLTNYGEMPILDETISYPGHTFIGWMRSDGEIGIIPMGTADVTYIAQWGVNKHNVIYHFNNGATEQTETIVVAEGADITRPSWLPTYEGYVFDDWYTTKDGNTKYSFPGKMETEDVHIYAHWTVETKRISVAFTDTLYDMSTLTFDNGSDPTVQIDHDEEKIIKYLSTNQLKFTYLSTITIQETNITVLADGEEGSFELVPGTDNKFIITITSPVDDTLSISIHAA